MICNRPLGRQRTGRLARLVRQIIPALVNEKHVGIMPEALLRLTGATCAVLGEGETVFPLLLRALEDGKEFGQVHGVAWLENDRYRMSPPSRTQSLASAPTPKFSHWLNLKAYQPAAAAPLQSKRGCPFSCIYYLRYQRKQYRLVSPKSGCCSRRLAAMGCRISRCGQRLQFPMIMLLRSARP
jgi:radical SAM superfamily enzyme YgiQ (UPF0313 family)